jgi:hypothetical protein
MVGVAGDFAERIDELAEHVGHGNLVGKDEVAQYYAGYVHEILRYHHPVGNAKFLERPLLANASDYFSRIGEHILDGGGALAMVDAVQEFGDDAKAQTPQQFDILRKSHHLSVTDDGAVVWDKPPDAAPISRGLYEALLRSAGLTHHRYGR